MICDKESKSAPISHAPSVNHRRRDNKVRLIGFFSLRLCSPFLRFSSRFLLGNCVTCSCEFSPLVIVDLITSALWRSTMTSRVASSVEEKKQIKVSLIMNKSRIGLTLPAGDCLLNVISLCVCPPVIIYSQPFPRIKPIDKTAFRPETVKVTILTLAKNFAAIKVM